MASIQGLSVKKVVTFQGREGQGTQCDVYYKGKNVGTFSDMGDGGESQVDVLPAIVDLFRYYEVSDSEYHFQGIEWAILDVLELLDCEKKYKFYAKKGHNALVVVKEAYKSYMVGATMSPLQTCQGMIDLLKDNYRVQFGTLPDSAFTVYRNLSDFEKGV